MFEFDLKRLRIQNRKAMLTIEGIKFNLAENEKSFAILGDSGIGKTTIFRSLFSRYLESWSIERHFTFDCLHKFDGREFDHNDILKNKNIPSIGFATQAPYFFNSETVFENIFLPLKWKKLKMSDEDKNKYISLFELNELKSMNVSILSGGQKQLINIARMLVLKPQIAIIDECFSSMNEGMSSQYINILKTRFNDVIFLITSHRKFDVEKFGCRYISLYKEQFRGGGYYVTHH